MADHPYGQHPDVESGFICEACGYPGKWLQDELVRVTAALAFYADPKHWESVEIEKISDVLSSWESGAAVDGGARARAALNDGTSTP